MEHRKAPAVKKVVAIVCVVVVLIAAGAFFVIRDPLNRGASGDASDSVTYIQYQLNPERASDLQSTYQDVLNDAPSAFESTPATDNYQYGLVDLDGDTEPELVVSGTDNESTTYIRSYMAPFHCDACTFGDTAIPTGDPVSLGNLAEGISSATQAKDGHGFVVSSADGSEQTVSVTGSQMNVTTTSEGSAWPSTQQTSSSESASSTSAQKLFEWADVTDSTILDDLSANATDDAPIMQGSSLADAYAYRLSHASDIAGFSNVEAGEPADYSIADLDGNDYPELLVQAPTSRLNEYTAFVAIVTYDESTGQLIDIPTSIQQGAASAGGFRGSVDLFADSRPGLFISQFSSGSGMGTQTQLTLEDGQAIQQPLGDISISTGVENPSGLAKTEIDWKEFSDQSLLEPLANLRIAYEIPGQIDQPESTDSSIASATPSSSASPSSFASSADTAELQEAVDREQANGNNAAIGTIEIMSYWDVLEHKGISEPNPGSGEQNDSYVMLVLDHEQDFRGMVVGPDRYSTRSSDLVYLGTPAERATLIPANGSQVAISFSPDDAGWPSDTSMPIGVIRVNDFTILNG